jgi:hypothetical protein
VEVRHDEGLAPHIGPEPCVGAREGTGEASARECTGQPWSRERYLIPGADAVSVAEGNTDGRVSASARTAWRGRRTWHVQTLLVREPGDLRSDQRRHAALARIGKARSRNR